MNREEMVLFNDLWHIGTDMMAWEYKELADKLKEKIIKTFEENKQLKANRDVVFTKEEMEQLLKQFQEIDKFDTALASGLMSKTIHFENEILKKKVKQLEININEAYKLLDDIDEYMLTEQHLKLVEAKKLLERSKGGNV